MIRMIVAYDQNFAIGAQGTLPWPRLAGDMEHFKKLTIGSTVVMGRRTYESIGHALPARRNIVLSRTTSHLPDAEIKSNIVGIVDMSKTEEVWIIGGSEVYRAFMPYARDLYVTSIRHACLGADTFFAHDKTRFTLQHESALVTEAGVDYTFQYFSTN